MTTRTLRIKAQIAFFDAQRQQRWAREQREYRRLEHAMPGAHPWVIDLTAWILGARNLDAGSSGGTSRA